MNMSVIRNKFYLIGLVLSLALSAAPNIALAQQQSPAALLLEVQALRTEIAELRDMVERQQYQLNRMKGGSSGNVNPNAPISNVPAYSDPNLNSPNPNTPAANSAPPAYDQPASQSRNRFPSDDDISQPNTAPNSATNATSTPTLNSDKYPQSQAPVLVEPVPSNPSSYEVPNTNSTGETEIDDGFYQPEPNSNSEPTPNSQSGYPPVEDRVIDGGTVNAELPSENPSLNQDFLPNGQPRPGVQSSASAPVAGEQGGVISVPSQPSTQASSSQPSFERQPSNAQQAQTSSVPSVAPASAARAPEQELYQQGFDLLKQSKHDEAVTVFKEQIESYPQGDASDDAHYWIAESMYVNRDLDSSQEYFKRIIENYPQSPRLPDALLKTAYIEQEQGDVIEAKMLLQEIVVHHPRSNAAISAKNRLAELN